MPRDEEGGLRDIAIVRIGGKWSSEDALVTGTHVIYALHKFSLINGIPVSATVVGAFPPAAFNHCGLLNYVKRSEAAAHG